MIFHSLFYLVIFAVPALFVGASAATLLDRFRLLPAGAGLELVSCLFACAAAGALLFYLAYGNLVRMPDAVQQQLLGRSYASPLSLRSAEYAGFKDWQRTWRYRVGGSALADLRRRCREAGSDPRYCQLASSGEGRTDAEVVLRGDELIVRRGRW